METKTTISMQKPVHERLLESKPFDSMSNGEMVEHLLDVYEDGGRDVHITVDANDENPERIAEFVRDGVEEAQTDMRTAKTGSK